MADQKILCATDGSAPSEKAVLHAIGWASQLNQPIAFITVTGGSPLKFLVWDEAKLAAGDLPNIKYLKPGNLYLFWGYRTYHSNFPVASEAVRATMLLHHGDPHPNSVIMKINTALQARDERRLLAQKAAV